MTNSPEDFDVYAGTFYRSKLAAAARYLEDKTLLPFFELYILRIVWAHEHERVSYGEAPQDDPGRHFVMKVVHECRALVGVLTEGSVYGAFHHGRTLIELAAVTYYLFGKSAKAPKRLQRWKKYRELYHYQHRRELESLLEKGELTKEQFDQRCLVGPQATAVGLETLKEWARVYDAPNDDVLKVGSWHPPFANLIANLARDDRFQRDFGKTYDQFSHATHLSPLSAGFVGGWKLVALDQRWITDVLVTAFAAVEVVLTLLPDVGPTLRELAVEEEAMFNNALEAM